MIGDFDVDLAHEFFQGFVNHALVTLHIDNLRGDNAHHQCETVFKAFARALRMAVEPDPRAAGASRRPRERSRSATRASRRMPNDIAVVDYGMGNLRSVAKALEHVAPEARGRGHLRPGGDPRAPSAWCCPGQGAMPDCMRELDASGLREAVLEAARDASRSSASASACRCCSSAARRATRRASALLPGSVRAFPRRRRWSTRDGGRLKVPHMGWNEVQPGAAPHPLWAGIADGSASISCTATTPGRRTRADAPATADYGVPFTCAIARDNIFAAQFHPEKSQRAGLQLLANFVTWNGRADPLRRPSPRLPPPRRLPPPC